MSYKQRLIYRKQLLLHVLVVSTNDVRTYDLVYLLVFRVLGTSLNTSISHFLQPKKSLCPTLCILHEGKIFGLFLAILMDNLLQLQAYFARIRLSVHKLSLLPTVTMFCVDSYAGFSA